MNRKWYQIWVSFPAGNVVSRIRIYDSTLRRIGAVPVAPDGIPLRNEDGTVEIRIFFGGTKNLTDVKNYLQFWGFTIEREQENEYAQEGT